MYASYISASSDKNRLRVSIACGRQAKNKQRIDTAGCICSPLCLMERDVAGPSAATTAVELEEEARVEMSCGRLGLAMELIDRSIAIEETATNLLVRSDIYVERSQPWLALKSTERALELDPSPQVREGHASALFAMALNGREPEEREKWMSAAAEAFCALHSMEPELTLPRLFVQMRQGRCYNLVRSHVPDWAGMSEKERQAALDQWIEALEAFSVRAGSRKRRAVEAAAAETERLIRSRRDLEAAEVEGSVQQRQTMVGSTLWLTILGGRWTLPISRVACQRAVAFWVLLTMGIYLGSIVHSIVRAYNERLHADHQEVSWIVSWLSSFRLPPSVHVVGVLGGASAPIVMLLRVSDAPGAVESAVRCVCAVITIGVFLSLGRQLFVFEQHQAIDHRLVCSDGIVLLAYATVCFTFTCGTWHLSCSRPHSYWPTLRLCAFVAGMAFCVANTIVRFWFDPPPRADGRPFIYRPGTEEDSYASAMATMASIGVFGIVTSDRNRRWLAARLPRLHQARPIRDLEVQHVELRNLTTVSD